MDRYEKKYQNPSFSANVLDAIYRSIDNGDIEAAAAAAEEMVFYSETMRKKQSFSSRMQSEKWVVERKKTTEKSDLGRTPATYFEHGFEKSHRNLKPTLLHSGSSSSDSSESEPVFVRPKPVRTGLQRKTQLPEIQAPKQQKPKQESFNKTKPTPSPSAKSHGGGVDLKKPKQPISPGGRIAGFLNSLFTAAGNAKKTTKLSSLERKSKSDRSSSSTCSSASSYSRSCLSKTPSSRGNSIKSVRFYPVGVIVDEDSRPCGQKHIYDREREVGHLTVGIKKSGECPPLIFGEELKRHLIEKNRQVEEAAKDLLKGYQKKSKIIGEVMRDVHENVIYDEEEEDDFDDGMSCSSSDLFELDNLAVIGIDRYREELPVYETTRLDTNRAIASGLIR